MEKHTQRFREYGEIGVQKGKGGDLRDSGELFRNRGRPNITRGHSTKDRIGGGEPGSFMGKNEAKTTCGDYWLASKKRSNLVVRQGEKDHVLLSGEFWLGETREI